jgi:xanthosine phosphorylase
MPVSIDEVMHVLSRYVPAGFAPKMGIILGSGLSLLADQLTHPVSIPFQAIPGLQAGSVPGHASLLALGYLNDIPVVCQRGRLHPYEGIGYASTRTLIHIMRHLGCSVLLLTAAVGSMEANIVPGDVFLVTDHINFQCDNPLVGPNDESVGPRFVDMSNAYDMGLQDVMRAVARRLNINLPQGVYISVLGPSFETPAEIRAFKQWGAQVVGMSVVPEVIIARHCGLQVAGLAAITNLATGLSSEILTHEGTLQFAEIAARKMVKLVPEFLKEWTYVLA